MFKEISFFSELLFQMKISNLPFDLIDFKLLSKYLIFWNSIDFVAFDNFDWLYFAFDLEFDCRLPFQHRHCCGQCFDHRLLLRFPLLIFASLTNLGLIIVCSIFFMICFFFYFNSAYPLRNIFAFLKFLISIFQISTLVWILNFLN